jgi:hypothetical protein
LGTAEIEAGCAMKLTRQFAEMTPENRPQDPHLTGLRFETLDHGGEYPDTMQAIKLIDAEPQSSRPKLQAVSAPLDL